MSLRAKLFGIVEIVLRVPPLFVIDELLKVGLAEFEEHDLSNFDQRYDKVEENASNISTTVYHDTVFYSFIVESLARICLSILGCGVALGFFVLNTKHLMVVYMYLTSVGVIYISYLSNISLIKNVLQFQGNGTATFLDTIVTLDVATLARNELLYEHIQNILLQSMLSFIFINMHLGPRYPILQKLLPTSFLMPSLCTILPIPPLFLLNMPIFTALLPTALVTFVLWSSIFTVMQTIYLGYMHTRVYVSNFGMSSLIETEWTRLNVPEVLRLFWILRVLAHATIFFISGSWIESDEVDFPRYYNLLKFLMTTGCDTFTAILGITSIVSFICNYIGKLFQWILLTEGDNDKSFGTVSAIVFYILALQTGLTSLEPEVRFIRLCRNFCLLFTALLHFIHNVVNPLLMSLSASHNPSLRRHCHALFVCGILVILPCTLMYFLWKTQETSTWLLAVTAFCIEVIVKVFVSLAIYALFLIDSCRTTFWEKLDDYIYYIRSFGNTVEFCFGIFLFFNGAWILLFESGSAIRAVMMCIHAYFNIWCDAKAGWIVFMKRRTAVNKIESLPEADAEQLEKLDDVCAICYQEMRSAKITKCNHFFHGVCLRKWLYVQDRCPLCHSILHSMDCENKAPNVSPPVENEEEEVNYDR